MRAPLKKHFMCQILITHFQRGFAIICCFCFYINFILSPRFLELGAIEVLNFASFPSGKRNVEKDMTRQGAPPPFVIRMTPPDDSVPSACICVRNE